MDGADQSRRDASRNRRRAFRADIRTGARAFGASGWAVPPTTVLDAPFSAEAITTVRKTLSNGTVRERMVTARYYRDSRGRVRAELVTPWGHTSCSRSQVSQISGTAWDSTDWTQAREPAGLQATLSQHTSSTARALSRFLSRRHASNTGILSEASQTMTASGPSTRRSHRTSAS
jgi:hypothetical protein